MAAPSTHDRRSEILAAALQCFLDRGYVATSIADIRRVSGASTGSIYHFFANKAALALALLNEALAGWSAASSVALDPSATAEQAIRSSVSGFVLFGQSNPQLVQFMDEVRTLSTTDPDFAVLRHALDDGLRAGEARYGEFLARGEVRALPWLVARALMLGPAYDYLRMSTLAGVTVDNAAHLLADAAWASVRPA